MDSGDDNPEIPEASVSSKSRKDDMVSDHAFGKFPRINYDYIEKIERKDDR